MYLRIKAILQICSIEPVFFKRIIQYIWPFLVRKNKTKPSLTHDGPLPMKYILILLFFRPYWILATLQTANTYFEKKTVSMRLN
jgi:hypothetical protein